MLHKRILSALLFLPVFYLVAWKLPPIYFTVLVTAAAVIGQYEFYRMGEARNQHPLIAVGMALGALVVLDSYQPIFPAQGKLFVAAIALLVILIVRLFSSRPIEGAIEDVSTTFLGVFYVALLFSFQIAIRMGEHGKQWLVFLYLIIWASDIGAYAVGIPFGKHRLYEKISPKKSIEGLGGALAASAGMALLCRIWLVPELGMLEAICIALALAAIGTVGDLVESMFKRDAGIKDSGSIIPGHGGILDRMDSMLFAAPVLFYYLRMH
jgi:phosphatidate cytidylyltransferase